MEDNNEKNVIQTANIEDDNSAINPDTSDDTIQTIPDEILERKIFLYGFGITIVLWLYIIIFQGTAVYFIIPAILMSLTMIFLFFKFRKKKKSAMWVETSFQDYKAKKKAKLEKD